MSSRYGRGIIYEIVPTRRGWYFRIVAKNGKTLAHSETYTAKHNCKHAVDLIVHQMEYRIVELKPYNE